MDGKFACPVILVLLLKMIIDVVFFRPDLHTARERIHSLDSGQQISKSAWLSWESFQEEGLQYDDWHRLSLQAQLDPAELSRTNLSAQE